jgi:hypothetical protein
VYNNNNKTSETISNNGFKTLDIKQKRAVISWVQKIKEVNPMDA